MRSLHQMIYFKGAYSLKQQKNQNPHDTGQTNKYSKQKDTNDRLYSCFVTKLRFIMYGKHILSLPHRQFAHVKGTVHPKMKILSSFTHPQVVPNLYECVCSAGHKGRYSEECGKQSTSGAPLTSIVFFFPTMEVNGAPKQPGY